MKINSKKIPIFISIFSLIFFCYAFYFLYNEIEKNNIITKEINIEMQKQMNRFDELRSLDRGIKMVEKEKTELETHFIQSSNLVPFLDTIEGLALKVGATAETVSVDISPDNLNLLVGLKARGSFTSLYKFLTLLENSPYELEFTSLDISKEMIQNTSKWEAKIKIKLISFIK